MNVEFSKGWHSMNYRTQLLGPLFTSIGAFILGYGAKLITLNEALNGITAVSALTIVVMMYKWADMQ